MKYLILILFLGISSLSGKNMLTIIHTPTSNFEKSVNFYTKLKYKIIEFNSMKLATDGIALIQINPNRKARAGVKVLKNSWQNEIAILSKNYKIYKEDSTYSLCDPSGVWVYLVETADVFDIIKDEKSYAMTGQFSGLSFETSDVKKSLEFWTSLGFVKEQGDENQGFVSVKSDDGMQISFMAPNLCPHLFFNPSMTYFNGKNNMNVIDNIRAAKIEITEEITVFNKHNIVDNIIIRDPGGYGFFIFND